MIKPINITFEENEQRFEAPIFSPDGFSPLAKTYRNEEDNGAILEIIDNRGTTLSEILDGISPIANVYKVDHAATITITDKEGTTTTVIYDGEQGPIGPIGPTGVGIIRIEQTQESQASGGRNIITIYLSDGTSYSCNVYNGQQGEIGPQGPQGPQGPVGPQGPAGMGVSRIIVGSDGKLYFYLVNGTVMVAYGSVIGPQGPKGETGEQGEQGEQGETGETGTGIYRIEQTTIGEGDESYNEVTIYLDDGTSYTFRVQNGSKGRTGATGATGAQGPRGFGISNTVVGSDGKLYIYFENGTVAVAGYVKGDQGPQGPEGPEGEPGTVEFFEQNTEPLSAESGALWLDTSV